jgi:hypothetical protein
MRIKIYIVSYNHRESLDNNLSSLFAVDFKEHNVEIYIINNHSNFSMNESFYDKVHVLHNSTRPNFSNGHLSRNWNQALMNGFKDLSNPDCDIVVCAQDDTIWFADSIEKLVEIHKTYSFYTCTFGDGFCSYTSEAVKLIGMWDERFCALTFQEADYFLRAHLYNKEMSSINDRIVHGRVLNATSEIVGRKNIRDQSSNNYVYRYSKNLFKLKWPDYEPEQWDDKIGSLSTTSAITNFVLYPYFEKHINLDGKNYFPLMFEHK